MSSILSKQLELLKKDLIAGYDKKNMRASGKFANSLEVIVETIPNETIKGLILGENYGEQLEFGRRSGKGAPVSMINQWILDKGVFTDAINKIGLNSLAFLIVRKIQQRGWDRKGFGGVGLLSEIITPLRIQNIIDEIGISETFKAVSEIEILIEKLEYA